MKNKLSILLISAIITGLIGTILVSQVASADKNPDLDRELPRPIPATDVKIIKKVFLPEKGEMKGKPATPPGKDKNNGPAATGVLGATVTGAKYAIVIGICDYPDTENDICWADGDSLNMYDALTNLYGYAPENIYLLKDMDATFDAIAIAVNDIKLNKEQIGDEVVFFFSGHGADGIARDNDSETRDEGIVVHDGSEIVIIWDGQLKEWFSDFDTTRIVFVFDSCLAGGMNDVADNGRVISMATGETQVAYVYSKGDPETGEPGEGVFSHYFVNEGMLQGLADKYDHSIDDGNDTTLGEDVVVEEAFDYAKGIIPDIYKRQNPVISDNFDNDLLL